MPSTTNRGLRLLPFVGFFVVCTLPCSAAPKRSQPTTYTSTCECRNNHGEDRWKAKTDPAAIPSDPRRIRNVTPSDMFAWSPLAGVTEKSPRKAPAEQQWCRVVGRVTEVKTQADGDIHFELADATGRKRGRILAEVPLGRRWCASRIAVFAWTKKGISFPPFQAGGSLPLRSNPVVTIIGKAFFDTHHAGKNPLTNRNITQHSGEVAAWEIHPVRDITQMMEVRRALPVRRVARRGGLH